MFQAWLHFNSVIYKIITDHLKIPIVQNRFQSVSITELYLNGLRDEMNK